VGQEHRRDEVQPRVGGEIEQGRKSLLARFQTATRRS
jgi:hypothetical protein